MRRWQQQATKSARVETTSVAAALKAVERCLSDMAVLIVMITYRQTRARGALEYRALKTRSYRREHESQFIFVYE